MGVVDWIVIHYTANKGDTAKNNADYFAREELEHPASAHYFVDEDSIWESVPLSHNAWHCGGGRQGETGGSLFGKVKNSNSIGVELCLLDKAGKVRHKTIWNAVRFVRQLMKDYDIPLDHVVRHWDVTGKECPAPMIGDSVLWEDFIDMLEDYDKVRYKYYEDMPTWAQPTVSKLVRKGLLKGDGDGVLDLSEDALKVFVVNDRAGLYD